MSKKMKPFEPIDPDGVLGSIQQTRAGFPVDEVSSALQKSVRRGLEEDALYWASEFHSARPENLWKRLRVMASEDVDFREYHIVPIVRALYENWKQDNDFLYVAHAVIVLVRASKSHIVVNAAVCVNESALPKREVPDYAVDKHTYRGKTMGRGYKHFFEVGAHLGNTQPEPDAYADRARKAVEGKDG
jgi:replication-associated recombination protein RarA